MIEKEYKTLDEAINAATIQVDSYKELLSSRGWKDLEAEIEFQVASLQEMLTTCDLDKVRDLQGQIAAFRWIRIHFDEVAENLERLMKGAKAEATE